MLVSQSMNKYYQVFKISFQQEFVYRVNFIMWRVRNVFQIFIVFFLWDTVFSEQGREIFGYDRARILTYVFGLIVVRAVVLSARAADVAGQISRGELSDYLIKPIDYFKYWFTRDLSSKLLNIAFALVEGTVLYLILRPPFFIQTNLFSIAIFLVSIVLAMLMFFILLFIVNSIPFWAPEMGWGGHFLLTVILIEFLSGALFPLDVLPNSIQKVLSYTPFPYLIFFPLQAYLGNISVPGLMKGLAVSSVWVLILWFVMKGVWNKGLKAYQAYGR
jgi:ABC-2 type transport system permease protein